ncbi:Metallo-beta-lactamase superfamily [Propionibacterium ruminifibrarum]|uniref:Metallo-beta-lactamase superfamily n=1 Tax=Propionibacterium ruminifibrarum TaxID=1962131 RepID=A0A375I148_9ACTN|nr:MBL fold metallo-hydrolase [Propionibacterium ruminifibrarum]SPF68534.1 Metallo-beta-lactamase superfamily [Propionibacterium ruminifibrarum]
MTTTTIPVETSFGPFINYCYILVDEVSREAAIIDPAWQMDKITAVLDGLRVRLRYVLITHSHLDHTNLAERFVKRYGAQLVVSELEHQWSGYGQGYSSLLVCEGQRLVIGRNHVTCFMTPGHTPGSACYQWGRDLFTGDTLFPDGCGICESMEWATELFHSLRRLVTLMADDVRILSGHSYQVANGLTFAQAKKTNIYLQIDKVDQFCKFRMRRGQKNLFTFSSLPVTD